MTKVKLDIITIVLQVLKNIIIIIYIKSLFANNPRKKSLNRVCKYIIIFNFMNIKFKKEVDQ